MGGASEDEGEARAQAAARRRELPDIVTFMLGTGVRIGEALAVRWCDVDLEGVPVVDGAELRAVPIVAITGNVVRHRGKGLHRHAGKTEMSSRIVPLPRFVVAALTRIDLHPGAAPDRDRPGLPGQPVLIYGGSTGRLGGGATIHHVLDQRLRQLAVVRS
jgi:integrase